MTRFALVGAAGYIAPRHMRAIADVGGELVAAVDPKDSVGVIDSHFPNARFFTEIERFDRHLEKLRRQGPDTAVRYVSICSPNYLHDAHIRLALRVKADAICEKPLVINAWNLDALEDLEQECGGKVYTVLQMRLLPALQALRERVLARTAGGRADVELKYITRRGQWYQVSWKGDEARSGGLSMNIGVHLFDMLQWIFGPAEDVKVQLRAPDRQAGVLELERARVRWFLSVNADDLPEEARAKGRFAWRTLKMDGEEIEFSDGFTDLHTRTYAEILAGRGFRIRDTRQAIELVNRIRTADIEP